jgi:RHS repeat-associated protein
VVYEKNVTTGQEASYVYGPAGKIAKHVNSTTDFYHTDHLGSTRLITDENGDVLTTVEYNPFGEDTITGEKESFSYTGKEKDSSGLYYYGARYYDPEIGRFISRDPVRGRKITPQTLNPYSYCLNNPLKYIDPDGRDPLHYKPVKGNRALQYSHAPQLMDYVYIEYDYTSFLVICAGIGIVLGGIALAMVIEAFIACAAMWWAGMSPLAKSVLIGIIIQMIIEGAKWVIRRVFGDGKFEEIETETGYVVINRETEEIIEGDRIHEGVHQVWVHVPGEGPLGGHWEDDVDCDGVPSSVDDDDNDPEVGDEDSNVP